MSADSATGRNPLVVAGIALGAILAVAALWFFVVDPLLLAGEETEESELSPAEIARQRAEAEGDVDSEPELTDEDEADPLEVLPIATYEVFLSRDPFEPVIPAADGAAPGDGAQDGVDGVPDGDTDGDGQSDGDGQPDGDGDLPPTNGDDGGQLPPTNGEDEDACTGEDEVVCDGRVVSLVDVFVDDQGNPVAVVQVDEQLYEVQTGDQFAENFLVRSIEPPCVTLLFGDDLFTLCEGERVLK